MAAWHLDLACVGMKGCRLLSSLPPVPSVREIPKHGPQLLAEVRLQGLF